MATRADTTIIVPTFNENENVARLVNRLSDAFQGADVELLFVDDSSDDTPAEIERVAASSRLPITLIHRPEGERPGGLSGAVATGIQETDSDYVIVMDGDLQHPPEMAPLLRRAAGEADLAVASRYVGEGDSSGLSNHYRRLVSGGSTLLAQACFPRRVGKVCTDPMTGFFAFRRDAVDPGRLQPRGFKILLEILARHDLRVKELPFTFGERTAGESKANWRNGVEFLRQMVSLRLGRMSRFAAVGALGTVVNLLVMLGLVSFMPYVVAALIAAEVSILHNFLLQERFVFHDMRDGVHSWSRRLAQHLAFNNAETLIRLPLLILLVETMHVWAVLAQAVTLAIAFVVRFLFVSRVVYRPRGGRHAATRPIPRAPSLPTPPTRQQRDAYLRAPQSRWVFVFSAVAAAGVAFSFYGLATQRSWTLLLFVPLALLVIEQVLSLRTSTFPRMVTLPDHEFKVDTWNPVEHPSVDVFLPTAGEDLGVLRNTYHFVRRLEWDGELRIYVLDDAGRNEVRELALTHGFSYAARDGHEFKKAGNLQFAYERTGGDHILILDADFVPRPDLLKQLVPYMDDPNVGIVQSPQYFSTDGRMTWLERAAGATQELFYRMIQPSRDRVGAAICVGTSAIYRRSALDTIGGFPLIGHSEDVYTGVGLGRTGYTLQYVPVLVSRGRCPDDIDAFMAQQYRWCEGSMSLVADVDFHNEQSMTALQRASFWSGFLYYISTAANAVLAPIPLLLMLFFFPEQIRPTNMIPLLGVLALWFVVFPLVIQARWRPDVLRVQVIYGFAHLFCIADLLRKHVSEWVVTGHESERSSVAWRIRRFMVPYIAVTQFLTLAGISVGLVRYGIADYWANTVLAIFTAYVYVPVAVLALKHMRPFSGHARTPVAEPFPATQEIER